EDDPLVGNDLEELTEHVRAGADAAMPATLLLEAEGTAQELDQRVGWLQADAEHTAGTRVERCLGPHPLDHPRGVCEIGEDRLRTCLDPGLVLDDASFASLPGHPFFAPPPRRLA